jgi:MFS family permease
MVFTLVGAGHATSHVYILALPPLFALIKADLEVSYAALGLLVTMFHVATGAMQIPAGLLVDRLGARVTLIAGMLLSATCMGAVGMTDAYWTMVCLTTLAGIGNSVFHPADYAILAASVDDRHLGKAFGFHLLAGNVGFAAAPVLMVGMAALWDWRSAVIAVGAMGVAVGLCMIVFGRNLRAGCAPARGDARGGEDGGTRALLSPPLLVMLGFFVLIALANTGVQTFSVTVLNALFGVPLGTANTALTFYLSAGLVGITVGGVIADRLRRPVVVVAASMLVSALALALVGSATLPAVVLFAAMAVCGTAMGVMRPARDMMVNAIAPPGATGKVFGFVGTGLSTGGAVAPVVFGWMVDIGASAWVFALLVLFVLLSIVAAVTIDRMRAVSAAPEPAEAAAD